MVRDRGKSLYSLPGGGIKYNEPSVSAAAREVFEELGLHTIEVTRIRKADYQGESEMHRVCLIKISGEPHLREELDRYMWWDMKQPLPMFNHVTRILGKVRIK